MDLKVLIVITKGETGGAQQSVFNLANTLKQQGVDVTVGTGFGEFLPEKLKKAGIKTIRFRHLRRGLNPVNYFLFNSEIKKLVKSEQYNVVHFNSSNALTGAKAAKKANPLIKTIFTFRGMSFLDKNSTKYKLVIKFYIILFKILLRHIDHSVFVSEENYNYGKKMGLAFLDKSSVIYNGLPENLNFLEKEEAVKELSKKIGKEISKDSILIGSIGRLAYQKNYEFLINNFEEIKKIEKSIKIIIIGEGPERNKYENLIKQQNAQENFILAGDIPDAGLLVKAFDIFVLPSRYEGMSITLIEAMMAGQSILATDVGGAKEMLEDCGFIYELDNSKEFLEKIEILLKNPEKRELLKKLSLEKSKKFSILKTAEKYLNLYTN